VDASANRIVPRAAKPTDSTRLAWLAWDSLMSNRHWLEGIVANTCAERANVPGYGEGVMRAKGWFGLERVRWGELFKLSNEKLDFFELHEEADIEHSDMGWQAIARFARELTAAIPGAELRLIEHGGHVYFWERAEAFNTMCLDFLAAH